MAEQGFTMIRFTNYEVNNSLNTVLKNIEQALLHKESVTETTGSSPSPLERGRGEVKRETSTMPGYAGSSWYFLRYMDPHNTQTFCDRTISDYWNQVDLYIGGTEHAVGHLLYSRLWTKVLFDLGHIGFDEPFRKLLNQGMIQGSSRFVYWVDMLFFLHGINANPAAYSKDASIYISYKKAQEFLEGNEKVTRELITKICERIERADFVKRNNRI